MPSTRANIRLAFFALAAVVLSASGASHTNTKVGWNNPDCHGYPVFTLPLGTSANDPCMQIDMTTYIKTTCTNNTGLTLNQYTNSACQGDYVQSTNAAVYLCRNQGTSSTAYLCAGTNPVDLPTIPGQPIPGDGTLGAAHNRYNQPADVPPHQPYRMWYEGPDCRGKFQYAETFYGITANDEKCYLSPLPPSNQQATCSSPSGNQPGVLTITSHQSGCQQKPFETAKYPVGKCIFSLSNSFIIHCGNN